MLDVAGLDVGVLASVSESDGIVDTVELTPETRVEIDGVADAVAEHIQKIGKGILYW